MCSAIFCMAQMAATLNGTVEDQSAAVISSAKATLLNENSGNASGRHRRGGSFPLQERGRGEYLLSVESAGFQNFETTVRVAGASLNLNIRMKIAAASKSPCAALRRSRLPGVELRRAEDQRQFPAVLPARVRTCRHYLLDSCPPQHPAPGPSIVVDGIEADQLDDLPVSAIKRMAINRNPYSAEYRRPARLALRSRLRRARPLCSTVAWPSTGETPHSMPATRLQRPSPI